MTKRMRVYGVMMIAAAAVATLLGATSALAEGETVTPGYALYLSSPGGGTVEGIAYNDEDVVRYASAAATKWAMHFDGSAAGLPAAADIDAYDYRYNAATLTARHCMSFDQPVAVPGLGTVDDSDIVCYRTSTVNNVWIMLLDGSAFGLTTDGEDIDAIDILPNNSILVSTLGSFSVPFAGSSPITGNNEDALMWDGSQFNIYFDGNYSFDLSDDNNLMNYAQVTTASGVAYLFYSPQKAQIIEGVSLAPYDIFGRRIDGLNNTYSLFWDASASGFPKIDAFDIRIQ